MRPRYCGFDAFGRPVDAPLALLAQFGTIDDRIMFGDCGCVYYYIRKQDLENCDFSRVWLMLQCY